MTRDATRRGTPRMLGLWLSGCVLSAVVLACGGRSAEIPSPQLGADEILFERGTEALQEEDWSRAREYFVQIRDNYPQSQYRADARLSVGDTYEGEGSSDAYVQALDEYRDFLSLYPTHPSAGYAQYKVGLVHFHQMRRPERDQTETVNAILEFERFITIYPDHQLMAEVQQRLRQARNRLSDHEYTVGHFYYRLKNYPGAISRFREILEGDPGYTRRDQVYFHLAESYASSDQAAEAIPYFARVLDEFEASEYAEQASLRIAELEASQER